MSTDSEKQYTDFHRWEELAEAYALQLERLRHRIPGASAELMRIAQELERYPSGFHDIEDLVRLQRAALEESRSQRRQQNELSGAYDLLGSHRVLI